MELVHYSSYRQYYRCTENRVPKRLKVVDPKSNFVQHCKQCFKIVENLNMPEHILKIRKDPNSKTVCLPFKLDSSTSYLDRWQ